MKKAVVFLAVILFNFYGFSNNPKKGDPKLGGWYMYFGNAKIEGMVEDLGMSGIQYNIALSLFFGQHMTWHPIL